MSKIHTSPPTVLSGMMIESENPPLLPVRARRSTRQVPPFLLFLMAVVAVGTFASDTRFLPIRNNIGLFELAGGLLILVWALYFNRYRLAVILRPINLIMALWFVVAFTSLSQLPISRINIFSQEFYLNALQSTIFLFQFLITLALFNFLILDEKYLLLFLRSLVFAVTIAAVTVLVEQFTSGGYNASGIFRSRSHMGIYLFGALWILLIHVFWPGIRRWERVLTLVVLAAVLYGISASLRQSVYVATIVGLMMLGASFVVLRGRQRFQIGTIAVVLVGAGAILYWQGGEIAPQLSFFRREINALERRLEEATQATAVTLEEGSASFDSLQRAGAFKAFLENPILGIGWLGFWRSSYSPTGNELHNTPLRFLAETGLVGTSLYVVYMFLLFSGALRLFLRARDTPYQASTLVLLIGFSATTISHWYNRMFTDRPYWILLILFLVIERLITRKIHPAEVARAGGNGADSGRQIVSSTTD